jgi:AhpC/TSA family
MMGSLRSRAFSALLAGLVLGLWMSAADRAGAVESGQPAPEFKLPSTLGNDIALSDFRGKKWVLLEFYSADFAPS